MWGLTYNISNKCENPNLLCHVLGIWGLPFARHTHPSNGPSHENDFFFFLLSFFNYFLLLEHIFPLWLGSYSHLVATTCHKKRMEEREHHHLQQLMHITYPSCGRFIIFGYYTLYYYVKCLM